MWHAIERLFLGTCDNWILAHTEMVLMLDVDFIGFLEISAPVGQVPSNSQIQLSDVTVPCCVVKKFFVLKCSDIVISRLRMAISFGHKTASSSLQCLGLCHE